MKIASVFIHGMWGTKGDLEFWRQKLEHKMQSKAIHLDRSNLDKITFEDYVNQVKRFCEDISADKLVVIGHSMGGLLAQKVEDKRITKRILAAPAAPRGILGIRNFLQVLFLLGNLNRILFQSAFIPSYSCVQKILFNKSADEEQYLQPESTRVFIEVLRGIYVPRRKNVEVFVGSQDRITPPGAVEKVAKYHGAPFKTFPEHDHCSICKDEEVADYVISLANGQNE